MNLKIKCLRGKLAGKNMQGMIITNPINIRYLTGITAEGLLLLTRRENIFITDARYIEEVNSTLTIDDDVIVYNVSDISKEDYENFFTFCENIGFEENHITYAKYKEYKHKYIINNLEETEGMIEAQRVIKDEKEIEYIKTEYDRKLEKLNILKKLVKLPISALNIYYNILKLAKQKKK